VRRGFTLLETAFATMLVGVALVALLQLMAAGTVANNEAAERTTAAALVANVHEATLTMTYANTLALDGKDYSPPVDARLQKVDDLGAGWKQHVDVDYVDPNHLASLSGSAAQPAARVTVTAYHNGAAVYTGAWVITQ
jgi:type II secretory pathway pseudopilin PulG